MTTTQHWIDQINLGNNGWTYVPADPALHNDLLRAGYVVIASLDLHGRPAYKAFNKPAQAALSRSPHGVSTYRGLLSPTLEEPDYEGAILDRQEAWT